MWLLLEYDRNRAEEAVTHARAQGVTVEAAFREDQLQTLVLAQVELLLVGDGWKPATLDKLREQGLRAPAVHVVTTACDEAAERARALGCVDVVAYPLPVTYLLSWPIAAPQGNEGQEEKPLSEIEQILKERGKLDRKNTYSRGLRVETEDIDALATRMRARIVFVHGIKGRIGKTTILALLAQALAARGLDVAVVDFDAAGELADAHGATSTVTVREWAKLPLSMDERMVKHSLVRKHGVWILPSGGRTVIEDASAKKVLYNLAAHMDMVLVDAGPEYTPLTRTIMDLAQRIVYVMTPDFLAIKPYVDGYEYVRHQKGDPNRIVTLMNLVERSREHKKVLRVMAEAEFGSELAVIPRDATLYRQVVRRQPLVGGRKTRGAIRSVLEALGVGPVVSATQKRRGVR
ncbi:MAG: nucleotide-binding protein [Bacilli bacterium]